MLQAHTRDLCADRLTSGDESLEINAAAGEDGDTFLHMALKAADAPADLVAYLVTSGADVIAKNSSGVTPLDLLLETSLNKATALVRSMDGKHANSKLRSGKALLDASIVRSRANSIS